MLIKDAIKQSRYICVHPLRRVWRVIVLDDFILLQDTKSSERWEIDIDDTREFWIPMKKKGVSYERMDGASWFYTLSDEQVRSIEEQVHQKRSNSTQKNDGGINK